MNTFLQLQPLLKFPFVFLVGFLVCFLFTPLVARLARGIGMIDVPDARRIHKCPVPRGGGIAVFLGFHSACAAVYLLPWMPFATGISALWWWHFLVLSSLLLGVGFMDDLVSLKPWVKLAGQTLVAALAFACDMRVGKVLGFELAMPLDFAVTVLWFLSIINAYNLIDGLDGLAAGLALIASAGLAGSALIRHLPGETLILLGLAGACLAFLRYNFHPASIFLGDTGSMFLGFTLAVIPLSTAAKGAAITTIVVPLLALGVAIFDMGLAIWRRSVRSLIGRRTHDADLAGKGGVFQADLEHVHHRLLKSGLSSRAVATWLYLSSIVLVGIGLLSMTYRSYAHGIYLLAFVAATYVAVKHIAKVELWDSGAAVVQGLRRPPNKVLAVVVNPFLDTAALSISLAAATYASAGDMPWEEFKVYWFDQLPLWVGVPFVAIFLTQAYSRLWSRARISDYVRLGLFLVAGILVAAGLGVFVGQPSPTVDVRVLNFRGPADATIVVGRLLANRFLLQTVVYAASALLLVVGLRALPRAIQDSMALAQRHRTAEGMPHRTALLFGAGAPATLFLYERSLGGLGEPQIHVAGLLDEDRNLHGRFVHGFRVLGGLEDMPQIIRDRQVKQVIVTEPLGEAVRRRLMDIATQAGVAVQDWKTSLTTALPAPPEPPVA